MIKQELDKFRELPARPLRAHDNRPKRPGPRPRPTYDPNRGLAHDVAKHN